MKKKSEEKMTKGANLSKVNWMALRAESFTRTMATTDGSVVSTSEVLNEIVTEWRTRMEKGKRLVETLKTARVK